MIGPSIIFQSRSILHYIAETYTTMTTPPTILVVGATGNTGRSVTSTLSELLPKHASLASHRILALTRSSTSPAAVQLASLPGVSIAETNWVTITAAWLREQNVVRAFIAPHAQPNQFADESTFHVACLNADVRYVVRVSTTAANVRPDCKAYYPRSHWAIETLLSSPEFARLQWTSLQPNIFSQMYLAPAAALIKQHRETGKQHTLGLIGSRKASIGIIDAGDVGIFAAHILVESDPSAHNGARYVLNGPEDITGEQVVRLVENYLGAKVEDVKFKDTSVVDHMSEGLDEGTKSIILSIKFAMTAAWEGLCKADTTSPEVKRIAAPKRTPAEILKELVHAEYDS